MTHVVTEACISCKYTDCVAVCPVDCFHEGPNFLVIDPEACIDCGVCIPECPVEAIVDQKDLPPEQADYLELNARLSAQWPVITQSREPLPSADDFANRHNKRTLLETAATTTQPGDPG
jgi:ferredoxin